MYVELEGQVVALRGSSVLISYSCCWKVQVMLRRGLLFKFLGWVVFGFLMLDNPS